MQFRIFHTNDIHSDFEFTKWLDGFMKRNRKEEDIFLDSGDFTDLRSLIVQADGGVSAMEMFVRTGVDYMTIGNNEVDLSYDNLCNLISVNKDLYVCANLSDNSGNKLPGLPGSVIFERFGKRFLVIGVAPFYKIREDESGVALVQSGYNNFSSMGNLLFCEPFEAVKEELKKQEGKYDFCILLSHGGDKVEYEMMRQMPEIDLCLGGHTHTLINFPKYSQSGKGACLGVITLETEGDSIKEVGNEMIYPEPTDNPEFDELYKEKENLSDRILGKELPFVRELSFDAFSECPLMNYVCDALIKLRGGELAIMHNGIAEGPLTAPASRKSLIELFPSKLNPTVYKIKGERILEAVKLSFDREAINGPGKGPGFRGHVLGTLSYSKNVRITKEPFSMNVNGIDLDPEKEYTIVTDDYLQRGTGYPSMKVPNNICTYHPWFIRDLVQAYLQDEEVFESAEIRRIL